MTKKRTPLRIQFAATPADLETIDQLSTEFGNVDRQSILRIALKQLADSKLREKEAQ